AGHYAISASGNLTLVGLSSLIPSSTVSGSLTLQANTFPGTVNESIPTQPNDSSPVQFNFTGGPSVSLAGNNVQMSIAGFVSLNGNFSFQELAPTVSGTVTTTDILIGADQVKAILGTTAANINISGANLGLLLVEKTDSSLKTQAAPTFALVTNAGSVGITIPGFNLGTGSSFSVEANTTGAPVSQTISLPDGGTVSLNFADGSNIENVQGTIPTGQLTIGNGFVSVGGNFSFSEQTITTQTATITKLLVGATGVSAMVGTSGFGVEIGATNTTPNGTLALAVYDNSSTSAQTYALDVSGAVQLLGTGFKPFTVSGNMDVRINTTGGPVNETIKVLGQGLPLTFTAAQGTEQEVSATNLTLQAGTVGGNGTVTKFATITGNFSIEQSGSAFTIGASNVTIQVGMQDGSDVSTFTGVSITGANLAAYITSGNGYALAADGGTDALVGITGLHLGTSGLKVRVNTTGEQDPGGTGGPLTVGGESLDFTDFGSANSWDGVEIEMTGLDLTVDGFGDVFGDFTFVTGAEKVTGTPYLLVTAQNVHANIGPSNEQLSLQGATITMVIRKPVGSAGGYALVASGGSATLSIKGLIQNLTLNSPSLNINHTGIDGSTLDNNTGQSAFGIFGSDPSNVVDVSFGVSGWQIGTTTLTASLSGSFDLSEQITTNSSGTQTKFLIGGSDITATVGISSTGLSIEGGFGLVIYSNNNSPTYALVANGTVTAQGLPANLGITATASLQINTTKVAVNETIQVPGGSIPIVFTDGTNGTADQRNIVSMTGSLTIALGTAGSFNGTLTGNFSLLTDTANQLVLIGMTGVNGSASDGSSTSASLSNGTLGLVINPGTGFALQASGT
ncbi:MAG TPA: hypothetical protein VFB72_04435, partial [Verrucomicrobiae bacterium]|nr:hypothetical protein [Verrucomicrobiae bacterium]